MTNRAKLIVVNIAILILIVAASVQFMPKSHAGVAVAFAGESSKDDWK